MDESQARRSSYLQQLEEWRAAPLVKVISGMRRVGKSTLLRQWGELLALRKEYGKSGVLLVECDSLDHAELTDWKQLRDLVKPLAARKGRKALLVDEIQQVEGWEKVITALHKDPLFDIYISGSNSQLLSGELATRLSGRHVELEVLPFGFSEHLGILGITKPEASHLLQYLELGGMPTLYHLPNEPRLRRETLEALYSNIVLKDVVQRYEIRNIALLDRIVRYFFDNIGNLFSAKGIADYCKSQRLSVGVETVQNYIQYLESCFVIHRVRRNDLKGKRILEVGEKLFVNDLGIRNAVLGRSTQDVGALLENVVYLELRRRGYRITVGCYGDWEVDFVAERDGKREYFQVCYQLADEMVRDREFRALLTLPDNHPKTVLSMDIFDMGRDGIAHRYLPEWLLGENGPAAGSGH